MIIRERRRSFEQQSPDVYWGDVGCCHGEILCLSRWSIETEYMDDGMGDGSVSVALVPRKWKPRTAFAGYQ